jgi:hypothetical protein
MNEFKIEKGKEYILIDDGPHIKLSERDKDKKIHYIKFATKKEIEELKVASSLKEIKLYDLRDSSEPNKGE